MYRVIVTNPEILMTNDELRKLWKVTKFIKKILAFVFDEGHCISQWGTFRKNYLAVGLIRHLISVPVPFYVASATLPPVVLSELRKLLFIRSKDDTTQVLCSNDRPDIQLMVRPLVYPAGSF